MSQHSQNTDQSSRQQKPEHTTQAAAQRHQGSPQIARPTTNEPTAWCAYWQAQNQPWRTEPEIDAERQRYLSERRSITPDIERGVYPFKSEKLKRADVEWLLATHEGGKGPIDWRDEKQQTRKGLDFRGANFCNANLMNLPLTRLRGGLKLDEWINATEEQRRAATVSIKKTALFEAHLEGADLIGAHLEGDGLSWAHLEGADLTGAHLEKALLGEAHLERVYLNEAYLEEADLAGAHLEGTALGKAHLEGANLSWAHLEGANLAGAHLEGANLFGAHLEGANLSWAHLEEARLVGASLEGTQLSDIILGNKMHIGPQTADVRWSTTNLAVIDWSQVTTLGDEKMAQQVKTSYGKIKDGKMYLDEYRAAVRANRQLAVALQAQGLNEEAAHFAYRAQLMQRVVLRRFVYLPGRSLFQRVRAFGSFIFSWFLDILAGYGYHPAKTLLWYLLMIGGFATAYTVFGHLPPFPDAVVFSFMSFHGRGFFPSLAGETNLHNPLVVLAAAEAVTGLFIEISFIATFTQRFFGK